MPQRRNAGAVVLGSDFKALGVVRSLGRKGVPCVVIDHLPRSAWFSRYVVKRIKWGGSMGDDELVRFLLNFGKEHHLEQWVLFPMQDEIVELVARHNMELTQIYRLVTQDWEVIRWANDKRQTYRMAEAVGVPYPTTCYPAEEEDLKTMEIAFPAIIKPAISVRLQYAIRLKALPVSNVDELREQYRLACNIVCPDEIMVQEVIPGSGETQYSVAAYCKEGRIISSMTARRTRQYPIDYGLGSSFVEAVEVPIITGLADKLLRHMNVSGMVEVEFKYDRRDGQYKLLDINVRPWGWHSLCMACGLDFPYMQYCDVSGQEPATIMPNYGHHWVRILTDVPAGLQEIRAGLTSPGAYVRSLMGRTVFSVFDPHDLLPVAGDSAVAFGRLIGSVRHFL